MKITANGIEFGGQSKVADWYKARWENDSWGYDQLNKGITFQDTFDALQVGVDIYAFLGGVDSIIRERVFDALATMMECSYDIVYYQWLNHGPEGPRELHDDLKGLRFKHD